MIWLFAIWFLVWFAALFPLIRKAADVLDTLNNKLTYDLQKQQEYDHMAELESKSTLEDIYDGI